jgi:ribonuclease-3
MNEFDKFEESIGIIFRDKALLRQAFTHRSYLNEHRELKLAHNERLEFLGDAVLELIITHELYRAYPKQDEGDLTAYRSALVNTNTLAETAGELGVDKYLLLSRGEAKDTGRARQYIHANTYESIVGAIYLDQGYDAAHKFVSASLLPKIENIVKEGTFVDSKSRLQEVAQEKMSITPVYETLRESGPDHDKRFEVGVFLGTEKAGTGVGRSKQEGEQAAARQALKAKHWM